MEETIAFRKGEYDFDFPNGHVHVSAPRDITMDEIKPALDRVVLEAHDKGLPLEAEGGEES